MGGESTVHWKLAALKVLPVNYIARGRRHRGTSSSCVVVHGLGSAAM